MGHVLRDEADLGSQECALRLLHGRVKAKTPVNLRAPSGLQLHGMTGPESRARKLQACSGGIYKQFQGRAHQQDVIIHLRRCGHT